MYTPQQQVFLWLTHTPPQSLDLLWLAGGSPGLFLGTQGELIQISWPPGILSEPLHHSLLPPGTCRRRHRPPLRGKCLESIHLGQHSTFLKNISINRKEWLSYKLQALVNIRRGIEWYCIRLNKLMTRSYNIFLPKLLLPSSKPKVQVTKLISALNWISIIESWWKIQMSTYENYVEINMKKFKSALVVMSVMLTKKKTYY